MTHTYEKYEPVTEYTDETDFTDTSIPNSIVDDATAMYTAADIPMDEITYSDGTDIVGTNAKTALTIEHNVYPQMPPQEVTDNIVKYQETGNKKYRDRVIYSHINFVHSVIRKCRLDTMIVNNASISYEDLLQVGLLGLMTAIDRFDVTKQTAFSTYAYFWVRQHILRYIVSVSSITTPVHLRSVLNRVAYIRNLLTEAGIEPTVQAIADETGLSCEFIQELAQYAQQTLSLDAPVKLGSDALGEFLTDTNGVTVEDATAAGLLQQTVEKYIFKLPAREQDILFMRLGLNGYSKPYTLQEIADKHDITRERVRQILQRQLRLMRYDKEICLVAGKECKDTARGAWYHRVNYNKKS